MSTTASRLAVLVFTDIVNSADLKNRIGATAYTPQLERHHQLFEAACSAFGGTVLKHTGDGFLASFSVVSDAVRAALRFQQSKPSLVATDFGARGNSRRRGRRPGNDGPAGRRGRHRRRRGTDHVTGLWRTD